MIPSLPIRASAPPSPIIVPARAFIGSKVILTVEYPSFS
jgi:hypothetical protein